MTTSEILMGTLSLLLAGLLELLRRREARLREHRERCHGCPHREERERDRRGGRRGGPR